MNLNSPVCLELNEDLTRDNRTTIWSVPRDWQVWYLALFNLQTICLLGLVSWHEVATAEQTDGLLDILIAIGTSMAGLIILVAAESIFLTDVTKMLFTMISDRYLRRQRARGREEGRAEGFAEAQEKWEEWNERRMAAEAAGEVFTEPPPSRPSANGRG